MDCDEALRLARECLEAELSQRDTTRFGQLAELLDKAISTNEDLTEVFNRAGTEDVLLEQYLRRSARRVAAEEVVPAGDGELRLILFGQPVLLPPGFRISHPGWPRARECLTNSLSALWVDDVESVALSPALADPTRLWQLSSSDVRAATLELFAHGRSLLLEQGLAQGDLHGGWASVILVGVAAVRPDRAQDFVARSLAPAGPNPVLSAVKHRFETAFETDAGTSQTPRWFPPMDWANVFSVARGVHFRTQVQHLVQIHTDARDQWSLSVQGRCVRLTNFRARVSEEFSFPEETTGDIDRLVRPFAQKLGLHFTSGLH